MKKILVFGGDGMLAYDFYKFQKKNFEIIRLSKKDSDIRSFENILQNIAIYESDVVLNCAAFTAVDLAETTYQKENYDINTLGAYYLAKATSAFGVDFITISTDYVFDGKNVNGYKISDEPNPINAYGMAKYLGEKLVLDANPNAKIIRTSWLYGGEILQKNDEKYPDPKRGIYKNFVNSILYKSYQKEEIRVVDDQFGRPTNARDLSDFIAKIILENPDENIFHFSSRMDDFMISWADFAEKILEKYNEKAIVKSISSEELGLPAKRPKYSILIS